MVGEQLPGHIIRDIRVASASFSLSTSQTWSTTSLVNNKDLSAGQLLMQLVLPRTSKAGASDQLQRSGGWRGQFVKQLEKKAFIL